MTMKGKEFLNNDSNLNETTHEKNKTFPKT